MNFKEWFELNEEKDACYHKVKARYDVWPSAYASGALVKCRKVGADNWGNSKKKKSKKKKHMQEEGVQIDETLADMRQYNDASMAVKQLRSHGYDVANMSAQEIIDALNSPKYDIEKRNKLFPSGVSPELFAARIKAVARKNVTVGDFGNDEYNLAAEVGDVLEFMQKHQFAISFRDPKILASTLRSFGWKSRFGLETLANAVLEKIRDNQNRLIKKSQFFEPQTSESLANKEQYDNATNNVVKKNDFNEGTFDLEKERGLKGWFDRNNGKGWIDCKKSSKGHLVPCGRKTAGKGAERSYPACRPTLSACNKKGTRRKKSSKPISWK